MNKKLLVIFILILASFAFGQFKSQVKSEPSIGEVISNGNNSNMILGFINPENFRMSHSYNLQFMNYGSNSLALGIYTNSMFYKISDPLNVQLDVSFMHSPYNSFGKDFQNNFNSVFISRAMVNWKPADNFLISVQYRNIPNNYVNPYYGYSRYNNYMYDDSGFNDWFLGK